MSSRIEQRLAAANIELPPVPAVAGNYVPWVKTGSLIVISGQVPFQDGAIAVAGRLGDNVTVEEGQRAARICALNLLAQAKVACDEDLDRLARCVKLGGFVACTAEFTDHPKVINGASDLVAEAMGDIGRHARFAVGAPSLPLGAAVEVEAMFEVV